MPVGKEVCRDPGDIVLDGDPAPPKSGRAPPLFIPCLLLPNGWMYVPLGMEVDLGPVNVCRGQTVDESRCQLVRKYAATQATLC